MPARFSDGTVRLEDRVLAARARLVAVLLASVVWWLYLLGGMAAARTIALVFDDSGSMRGQRYAMARYATQNFAALLAPTDTLKVVRMSRPDVVEVLLPEQGIEAAIRTVAAWPVGGATPYVSVQTAIAALERVVAGVPVETDTDDYWLVVISDGEFNDFAGNMARAEEHYRRDLDRLRETFQGRKLGVVYLGISERAQEFADPWEAVGATTFTAFENDEIADAMFSMSALITGRDMGDEPERVGLAARPGTVSGVDVDTMLPLQRLVVFYQGEQPAALGVDDAASELVTTLGESVHLRSRGPYRTADGGLHGVVTAVEAETLFRVLRPGTFNLAITSDRLIELESLRFLPEVALDLQVDASEPPGTVCAGDEIELVARLHDPGAAAPFRLDTLLGLDIRANVDADVAPRSVVPFALDGSERMTATIVVPEGRSVVSVTARFPGYFDLRSRLLEYEGVACVQELALDVAPERVDLVPTTSATLVEAHVGTLQLTGAFPGTPRTTPYRLEVTGLPSWMVLSIGGRVFDTTEPEGQLDLLLDDPVAFTLLHRRPPAEERDERYDVRIRAESLGPIPVRWLREQANLVVAPRWVDLAVRFADASAGEPFELDLRRTASSEPEAAATVSLIVDDEAAAMPDPARYRFIAEDVPSGVWLRAAGVMLGEGDHVDVTLSRGEALPVVVERNEEYRLQDVTQVRLRAQALDTEVSWRNDTLTFALRPLATRVELAVDPGIVEIAYTGADALESVAAFRLEATVTEGVLLDVATTLSVEGLPEGLVLRVGDSDIDRLSPEAVVPTIARPIDVEVLTDASFRTRSDHVLAITASSSDRAVRWSPTELLVVPVARAPGLEWREAPVVSRVDQLYGARFPAIAFADHSHDEEDRTRTAPGELADWEIDVGSLPTGLRAAVHLDPDANVVEIELVPRARLFMFAVPTGAVAVPMAIHNTATGERGEARLTLQVDDVGWWEKTWRAIAALAGVFLAIGLLLLAVAWWRRPRFRRGAGMEYSEANDWVDSVAFGDEDAPSRIHRRAVLFARSLIGRWSLRPQRAIVDGVFTVRATRRSEIVLEAAAKGRWREPLPAEAPTYELASVNDDNERFALLPVDRVKDTPIRLDQELGIFYPDGRQKFYRYRIGLPDYR